MSALPLWVAEEEEEEEEGLLATPQRHAVVVAGSRLWTARLACQGLI